MSCGCGSSTNNCGCGNCFPGVTIPVGPQGSQGVQGIQGPQGIQGQQGLPGEIEPIEWIELPLSAKNTWEQTGNPTEIAFYAIWNGLLLMRGKIKNDNYNAFKGAFWESAPVTTGAIDTMAIEDVAATVVKIRVFDEEMLYVGATNDELILCLDSIPPIRLY